MKVVVVGDRPVLNQRIAKLLDEHGFEVAEASFEDDILQGLTEEAVDLLLLVAPDPETNVQEFISACKAVRPSLHTYVLARDGSLAQLIPQMQSVLGKSISINGLPGALREELHRANVERDHFRAEGLARVNELLAGVLGAKSLKEAAQKTAESVQGMLQAKYAAVVLVSQERRAPSVLARSGDEDDVGKVWKGPTAMYQWIVENEAPLIIRRGRSTIPAIQREITKFGLGPCMFVPIMAEGGLKGLLVATREQDSQAFSDAEFLVVQAACKTLAFRLGPENAAATDALREMLQRERTARQQLEDRIAEERDVMRRFSREVAAIVDIQRGMRPEASETIAKMAGLLAEQLDVSADYLAEAAYLRDIGALAAPGGAKPASDVQDSGSAETCNAGFEILTRVRMPPACLEVARHHRENWDGSGVPDGISREDIPLFARLVRVVEDYVTMTSPGVAKQVIASPVALGQISREAGRLYDPHIAETFIKIIRAHGVTPEQETLSLIAHELRTPLTYVAGFSELLAARQDMPSQAREMATELQKQTEQMVTLTERLLEISRLQSGRVSLTWQWVDMTQLVTEQVNQARTLSSEHTLRLEAPNYQVRLRADQTRVAQAVTNLLSNAVKYSPKGGEVTVKLEETPQEVTVRVADQGVGISKEQLDRLFQPFYRAQHEETRQVEGLGLGLALTRAVIEAHGGKIWAESQPGKGSVFSFSLPKQEAGFETSATAEHDG